VMNVIESRARIVYQLFTVNSAKEVDAWTVQSTSCAVMILAERLIALNVFLAIPVILDSSTNAMIAKENFVVLATHWSGVRMTWEIIVQIGKKMIRTL
jgi:hypothetical protein